MSYQQVQAAKSVFSSLLSTCQSVHSKVSLPVQKMQSALKHSAKSMQSFGVMAGQVHKLSLQLANTGTFSVTQAEALHSRIYLENSGHALSYVVNCLNFISSEQFKTKYVARMSPMQLMQIEQLEAQLRLIYQGLVDDIWSLGVSLN